MKKILIIFCVCLNMFIVTGCWDRTEIDRNIFIGAIGIERGIDIDNKELINSIESDQSFKERNIEKIKVTLAYPDLSKYSTTSGGMPEDKTITSSGFSIEDVLYNISKKSSRTINLDYTKLFLVSDELLSYPEVMKEVLDFMLRQPSLNRSMQLVAVKGSIEDYMNVDLYMEKNIHEYIGGLIKTNNKNGVVSTITINQFLTSTYINGNGIIPALKLDKDKKQIVIAGVAIVKDYKVEGYLDPQNTSVMDMLKGNLKNIKKSIYKDQHPLDMEFDNIDRKIAFKKEDGKYKFYISLSLDGRINDHYLGGDLLNEDNILKIQAIVDNLIADECYKFIKQSQKEWKTDLVGFGPYLKKFHPDVWKDIKDSWEDIYKDIIVNVDVKTTIRRIGTIK